jgi:UDP-glucuronate 4-epimerase
MQHILITGAAGFIGFHLSRQLLKNGYRVSGVDSLNDYYSVTLKRDRLKELEPYPAFSFKHLDLSDRSAAESLFAQHRYDAVVHLAAQAGVRYSIDHPHAYAQHNVTAFLHVLEGCRAHPASHLVFASSSSIYGENKLTPFSVDDRADKPVSLYAATKLANEHMAYAYASLFKIPTTGLRFFTVYGPWGRPDMAYYKFTKAIVEGTPIDVYNNGNLLRDFTYVDDVTEALQRLIGLPPKDLAVPFRLHNVGNHEPMRVSLFLDVLERLIGRKAIRVPKPMQLGDVSTTFANVDSLAAATGFSPSTSVETGLERFVEWYLRYHQLDSSGALAASPRRP